LSDLARQIPLDATFDFIGVSSYGNRPTVKEDPAGHAAWDSLGEVRLTKDMDQSMADRNVILVEDILDTGLTLNYISKLVRAHQPRSLRIAALLDKPSRRKQPIEAHYIGFTIPDAYVVGYGLDYAERYRNLPDICVLENLELARNFRKLERDGQSPNYCRKLQIRTGCYDEACENDRLAD
jgi:hypoxanthine phosphoribosyltransferase